MQLFKIVVVSHYMDWYPLEVNFNESSAEKENRYEIYAESNFT